MVRKLQGELQYAGKRYEMYKILRAEELTANIFLMEVEAKRVADACMPGQFVIVRKDEEGERIPLTICDYNREKGTVTIIFQIVGNTTMKLDSLEKGDEIIGTRVRAKVTKNKVAPPYRQAEFTMLHGEGISREACLLDKGVEAGILDKSGSWFIYGDEKLGQGAENARQYLKDNPQLAAEIEDKLYVKYLGHHYDGSKAPKAEDAEAPAKKGKK